MIKKLFFSICIMLSGFLTSLYVTSCKTKPTSISSDNFESYPHTDSNWIDWNISVTSIPGMSNASLIEAIKDSLVAYAHSKNPDTKLIFRLKSCPCDSLLTNINASIIYGSGQSVPPPPTSPKPGPTGDFTVGTNIQVYNPEFKDSIEYDTSISYKSTKTFTTPPGGTRSRKVLAVIDTGLDTLRFQKSYPNTIWQGDLLWQDPANETLFNVVVGEPEHQLIDNTSVKHGTDVTAIVLTQLSKTDENNFPQIMSIRAFNKLEQGSIYTVSCALSYAIQHNADFINASWGYFGRPDSVLLKYLLKASNQGIRIIAAAGNSPFPHDPAKICFPDVDKLNFLDRLKSKDSLFYPAAFAPTITNLVSVTQLHQVPAVPLELRSCYYQDFSQSYITVGAYEKNSLTGDCCKFHISFLGQPIEGSSFATPVLTAIFIKELLNKSQDIKTYIDLNMPKESDKRFTLNGNYYEFVQIR